VSAHRATSQPTGDVTFLFTDIEGSTQRWEAHSAAMTAAVALHDSLVRSAIERHGGHVFKTVGDAFCAAFSVCGRRWTTTLLKKRCAKAPQ
jgi:class 3 adenylate cyclase